MTTSFETALDTWANLNDYVMNANTTEQQLELLLQTELNGKKRKMFVARIHSRMNKLRAHRERKALRGKIRN